MSGIEVRRGNLICAMRPKERTHLCSRRVWHRGPVSAIGKDSILRVEPVTDLRIGRAEIPNQCFESGLCCQECIGSTSRIKNVAALAIRLDRDLSCSPHQCTGVSPGLKRCIYILRTIVEEV